MERKENESYLEYIKRITLALEDKNISYLEWGDYILGVDNCYSSENLRKGYYIVSKMLDKIDLSLDYSSDDMIKLIESQREELYKERVKLQDQRREYNKNLREEARWENLRDNILDHMEDLPKLNINRKPNIFNHDSEAVLICSDWHYGLKIDNQTNYFDTQVCKERVEELTNKTINYCKNHKVNKINICLAGDFLSGIIQQTARIEQEEDVVQQLIECTELICQMVNTLKNEINEVVVYGVWGNHSRIVADKKNSLNRENIERLIPYYIKSRINDIKVIDSHGDDYLTFKIHDKNIVLSHGDKDTINNALVNYTRLLGYAPSEILIGHTHAFKIYDDCDTEIVVNGSLCGSDDYAISLRKATKPSQILRIYDDNVCTYKIVLD